MLVSYYMKPVLVLLVVSFFLPLLFSPFFLEDGELFRKCYDFRFTAVVISLSFLGCYGIIYCVVRNVDDYERYVDVDWCCHLWAQMSPFQIGWGYFVVMITLASCGAAAYAEDNMLPYLFCVSLYSFAAFGLVKELNRLE